MQFDYYHVLLTGSFSTIFDPKLAWKLAKNVVSFTESSYKFDNLCEKKKEKKRVTDNHYEFKFIVLNTNCLIQLDFLIT